MSKLRGGIAGGCRNLALALAALALATGAGGCGGSANAGDSSTQENPPKTTHGFDTAAAWQLIKRQVAAGQRPAGSPQLRRLASQLRPLLPKGEFEPLPGEPRLRNIVGTIPGREPAIVLGAHYDTLTKPRGFVGANNGAAGTAIVIEAARALAEAPASSSTRAVHFVLFDGEEPAHGKPEESSDFYHEGLRGSRAYANAHKGKTRAMILLDYVAGRGLHLPREANSSRGLWQKTLAAAREVGTEHFFSPKTGPSIVDDHVPFLLHGVPAVDFIDWSYPGHSLADGIDRLSPRSVEAVGKTVVQLVEDLR
jgi:glutaminyl-peptide cyclotransferase